MQTNNLQTYWLWQRSKIKSEFEALMDIHDVAVNGVANLSIRDWAKRWGWDKSKASRFITLLDQRDEIETIVRQKTIQIKVSISERYTGERDTKRDKKETKARQQKELPAELNIPFEKWWNLYDKKKGMIEKVAAKWAALSDNTREQIMQHTKNYLLETPDKQYRMYPMTYLNNNGWKDEIISNGLFGEPQAPGTPVRRPVPSTPGYNGR